jgi:uncharacterized protein YjiS (DUF1127 family)
MSEMTCNVYDVTCCPAEPLNSNPLKRLGKLIRCWTGDLIGSIFRRKNESHAAEYLKLMNDHELRDIGMEPSRVHRRPLLDLRHRLLVNRNWF